MPWRARDFVHHPLRERASRPQLKRDPLDRRTTVRLGLSSMDEEFERKTEEKAQLVPPVRRPPTALGTGTPPPPPPPRRPPPPSSPSPWDPSSVRALVRRILATGMDVADIVAAALTKTRAQPPHRRGRGLTSA